jgi:hypothetical protein
LVSAAAQGLGTNQLDVRSLLDLGAGRRVSADDTPAVTGGLAGLRLELEGGDPNLFVALTALYPANSGTRALPSSSPRPSTLTYG